MKSEKNVTPVPPTVTPTTTLNTASPLAHGGPFLTGFLVNTAFGYVLYFIALALSEPPAWAFEVIEYLKPTIKALDTAARLSDRPFAAQVTILYAAFSAIPLAAYFVCLAFIVKKIRQELYRHLCLRVRELGVTWKLRLKFAGQGALILLISVSLFPMALLLDRGTNISWQATGFFSTSIFSVAFLLLTSGIVALTFILGLGVIYASISSYKPTIKQGANHG